MKKIIAVLLTAILAVSLAACGSSGGQSGSNTEDNKENEAAVDIPDAVTLLTTVWDSYTDDEKFPAIGGDFSEANARQFRYEFFREVMAKSSSTALVTAHHADDQVETIFMRLIFLSIVSLQF